MTSPNPSTLQKQLYDVAKKRHMSPAQHVADRQQRAAAQATLKLWKEERRVALIACADRVIAFYGPWDPGYAIERFMQLLRWDPKLRCYDNWETEERLFRVAHYGRDLLYEEMTNL